MVALAIALIHVLDGTMSSVVKRGNVTAESQLTPKSTCIYIHGHKDKQIYLSA